MKNRFSLAVDRRRFLKQLGAAGAVAVLPGAKLAAIPDVPQEKRVVFVYVPGGAPPKLWMPQGCSNMFSLSPVSAPLEPVKQHCVFFDGVSLPDAGHGIAYKSLGGSPLRATVDVVLGQHLQESATHSNLFLASTPNQYREGPLSYSENGPIIPADNPFVVYRWLFEGELEKVRASHPAFAARFDAADEDEVLRSFDSTVNLNIELTCLALALNQTRVVTLELGDNMQDFYVPESGIDVAYDHATHAFSTPDAYAQIRTHLTKKVAYLIQLLEATSDRYGQSLLDNTIVVQVADMGDAQSHGTDRLPYMLAGGSNWIRNGLFIQDAGSIAAVLNSVSTALNVPPALIGDAPPLPVF